MESMATVLLEDIQTNVEELITYSDAGGDKQYAFDLYVDTDELKKIEEEIASLMRNVSAEHVRRTA